MSKQQQSEIEEYAKKELRVLRQKLLDLSRRNTLLNFRHRKAAKNQLRIVDEVLEFTLERLKSGKDFQIAPLPDPDDDTLDPEDEKTPEFKLRVEELKETDEYKSKLQTIDERLERESDVEGHERGLDSLLRETKDKARKSLDMPTLGKSMIQSAVDWAVINGIEPSYELPRTATGNQHEDNKLQTLYFRKSLDGKLNALSTKASLIMGEKGVNTLYAAFGFLEWYESRNSNIELLSPLILLPLNIEKDFKRGEQVYTISSIGDPVINETLRVKLQLEGVELPQLEDDQELDLSEYFEELEEVIDSHSEWKIHKYLTLGLFSFHKIAMYEDLNPDTGEDGSKPHQNKLVSTIIAGRTRDPDELSQEPTIHNPDEYESLEELPKLILDADSSQFSAVVDALAGKNLIIQGPPGTGKSQTISNIIGAAMIANKSVLFVSEKLSALQVVKKRLDEHGVGDYCLEIHSNKSNRADFVAELRSRLNRISPSDRGVPYIDAKELKRRKKRMQRYLDLMKKEIAHSGLTVEDALWLSQKGDYTSLPLEVRHFRFENANAIHRSDITRLKKELRTLIEVRGKLGRDIKQSPWNIIRREDASNRLVADILDYLGDALRKIESLAETYESFIGRDGANCPDDLKEICTLLESLSSIPSPDGNRKALYSLLALTDKQISDDTERLQSLRNGLDKLDEEARSYFKISSINDAVSRIRQFESMLILCEAFGVSNVEELQSASSSTAQKISEIESIANTLKKYDRWANSESLLKRNSVLQEFINGIRHVNGYPNDIPEIYHSESLKAPEVRARIKKLKKLYNSLCSSQESLLGGNATTAPPIALNLSNVELFIDQLQKKGIFSIFSSTYRQSRKSLKQLYGERLDDNSILELLKQLSKILQQQKIIEDNSIFTEFAVVGDYAKSLENLSQMSEWLCRLDATEHVEQAFRIDLFDGNHHEDVIQIKRSLPSELLTELVQIQQQSELLGLSALSDYRQHQEKLSSQYQDYIQEYPNSADFATYTKPMLEGLLAKIQEYARLESEEEGAAEKLNSTLEVIPHTSIEAAIANTSHLKSLKDSGMIQLSGQMLTVDEYSDFYNSIQKISSGLEEVNAAVKKLSDQIGHNEIKEILSIYDLRSQIRDLNNSVEDIEHVCDWLEITRNIENTQAKDALKLVESDHLQELCESLEMLYALTLIDVTKAEYKELDQFSGSSLSKDRETVREVDAQLAQVSRYEIKKHLHALGREAPRGIGHGSKKQFTEMSLINHQTSLTRPSMPPKRIIKQATESLQKMFPCFMMSPLTVAEYLNKEACNFDLVVFDEASQIRPEDALGALLRADQFVVVGDNKQLPPTSFFNTSDDVIDDELDKEDIEEISAAESILEKAESTYGPSRMLLWHYRSQHPSLIAYSNREFYEDRLNIFPSPEAQSSSLGVKSHFISEGIYGARCNLPEAKELIKGVVTQIRNSPKESIGIVAMNEAQRDLISGLLDLEFAHNEDVNDYRIRWHETLEPIFIKNLENVQGDERDIIFISTVYGKNMEGAMFQRFGPINSPNGHRRLNVLFTRAKRSIQLYTSLSPADILVEENSSRGKRVFREYIEYARSGRLEAGVDTGRDPDSEFEIQVAEALRAKGYKCDYQVGASGFFIDLAVQHPANSKSYILGVECDGAKYHSFKSARDRDRLREDALVSKGWKIHRIWSTDWFKNRDKEIERLISRIEEILKGA